MEKGNNFIWLLLAVGIVGFAWYQSSDQNLQARELKNCQSEFKSFKDGITYGRK